MLWHLIWNTISCFYPRTPRKQRLQTVDSQCLQANHRLKRSGSWHLRQHQLLLLGCLNAERLELRRSFKLSSLSGYPSPARHVYPNKHNSNDGACQARWLFNAKIYSGGSWEWIGHSLRSYSAITRRRCKRTIVLSCGVHTSSRLIKLYCEIQCSSCTTNEAFPWDSVREGREREREGETRKPEQYRG